MKRILLFSVILSLFFLKIVAQPITGAPTPPTRNASDVISLFSDAYTNVAGTDWFPNWGQSTVVSEVSIGGNPTKKYLNLNYQGVQFSAPVNASSMTSLHVDIWTTNCTALDLYLINTSPSLFERKVTINPTLSGWYSIDIPLSQYSSAGVALSNIGQFKFVGTPSGTTVYLDNIYFWKSSSVPTITNFSIPRNLLGMLHLPLQHQPVIALVLLLTPAVILQLLQSVGTLLLFLLQEYQQLLPIKLRHHLMLQESPQQH